MSTPLFIGEFSALEFWRSAENRTQVKPTKARPQSGVMPSSSDLEIIGHIQHMLGNGETVLILDKHPSRWSLEGTKCRSWNGCSTPGAFAKIVPNLYVSTPEATFVQIANKVPFPELIRIGMELCGTYSMDENSEEGFRGREPLSSTTALERFILKSGGATGAKQARRALRYIANGSASPAETNLTILLCLPTSLGGFGLPLPQLNKQIEIGKGGKAITRKQFFKCDLLWPEIRTAIEYDSDSWHTGQEQQADDASRRNALESLGFTVITATKAHLYNASETERLATIIARRLNRYHRSVRPDVMTKRYELRKLILHAQ